MQGDNPNCDRSPQLVDKLSQTEPTDSLSNKQPALQAVAIFSPITQVAKKWGCLCPFQVCLS